ncbi:MAG: hypothetical protein Q9164_001717 [Protoblastenia rupestris]
MSRLKRQRLTETGHERVTATTAENAALFGDEQSNISSEDPIKPQARRSLFVRSLPASATTESLTLLFSQSYPLRHATVVIDKATGKSKGFGFVTFADIKDAESAQKEFNGVSFDGSEIKVEVAEPRNRQHKKGLPGVPDSTVKVSREQHYRPPPKLIVRNLPWSLDSEQLGKLFMSYGKVKHASMPKLGVGLSAGFGFVVLRGRKNAERALKAMNGKNVDGRTLAVDWAVVKETWEDLQKLEEKQGDSGQPDESIKSEEGTDIEGSENILSDIEQSDEPDGEDVDANANEDDKDKIQEVDHADATEKQSTLFVRNIPFTVTDGSLLEHFTSFGPVRYARIVVDQVTKRSKGTGFICFFEPEDAKRCLHEAPRPQKFSALQGWAGRGTNASSLKQSVLQDTSLDRTGRFTLEGRVLDISFALGRAEAARLTFTNSYLRDAQDRDRRHWYLLSEGTLPSNSPLYISMSPSEVKMREDSAKQRQTLIRSNPMLHVSLTRLSIRNLPRSVTSKDLKLLAREAVVGFAKDVKAGSRTHLSKEEVLRGGDDMRSAEKERKGKGKGIVKQAKVVFEGRDGSKVAENSDARRSRGYGFIEYSSHRWALMSLRWLNGYAMDSSRSTWDSTASTPIRKEKQKRLIVEFAIENAQVVLRRQQREGKARERSKLVSEQREKSKLTEKTKQWSKNQLMAKTRKGMKRKWPNESSGKGTSRDEFQVQDSRDVEKEAKRQRIIGRKRMSRKVRRQVTSS